jgi:predicted ATPase
MTHVIRQPIVAKSLSLLRGRRVHPLFTGYLHLQQLAGLPGPKQAPNFIEFFQRFFLVKDHPLGTPYIKPFTNQKASEKNLWLNENVAGSYAPSSLRPDQPFRKVVDVDKNYSLRDDHAKRALKYLLYDKPLSVADLSVFLYRDFGLLGESPTVADLIDVFAVEFSYASAPGAARHKDFGVLYCEEDAGTWGNAIFEPGPLKVDLNEVQQLAGRTQHHPKITVGHVRSLTSKDLLASETKSSGQGPPLQELRIKGLLSFGEETVLEFGRLNLLVGANGSGKSNLVDCIRLISQTPLDIQGAFTNGGFESWLYNGLDKESGSGSIQAIARVPELADLISHKLKLGPPSHSRAQLEEHIASGQADPVKTAPYFVGSYRSRAVVSVSGGGKRRHDRALGTKDYNPFQSILSQVRDVGQFPEITRLGNLYSSFRIYSEWSFGRDSKLREAAPAGRSDARLSESMDDLPVALNALEQTAAHESIRRLLPELKDTYRDYVTRVLFGRVGLELVEESFEAPVPASRLSDGTLRFLALAAILLQPAPPPVICIEEPELGMHPDMIRMVAQMIADASAQTQLIVTTHSEHLLTALEDNFDVLFAFDSGTKGSVVQRLLREDFHKWRAEHSLGDLWSSGELGGVRY